MLEIKGEKIKTLISEMTVEEFDFATEKMGDENEEIISRYFKVMEKLGASRQLLDGLTTDELLEFSKLFGKETLEEKEIPEVFEVNGVNYRAHNGNFALTAKDLWQIEKMAKKESRFNISKALAICLKREDVEPQWHYNDSHIQTKADIFKTQPVGIFMPLIVILAKTLGKKVQMLNEATK
jgi:hypothetical protein